MSTQDFLTELCLKAFLNLWTLETKGENISYWHSDDSATVNNHWCDQDAPKQGRPGQLNPKEEYF